jgi:hypothetical protein
MGSSTEVARFVMSVPTQQVHIDKHPFDVGFGPNRRHSVDAYNSLRFALHDEVRARAQPFQVGTCRHSGKGCVMEFALCGFCECGS